MDEKEVLDILDKLKDLVTYVNEPLIQVYCDKEGILHCKNYVLYNYLIDVFLNKIKNTQGISKIYVFKNPLDNKIIYETMNLGIQMSIKNIRAIIISGNKRYSIKNKKLIT